MKRGDYVRCKSNGRSYKVCDISSCGYYVYVSALNNDINALFPSNIIEFDIELNRGRTIDNILK